MIICKRDYEKIAREIYANGSNCSASLFNAFKDDYVLSCDIPKPRSVDGLCCAVLTTKTILKEIGKVHLFDEYKNKFMQEFGYLKCIDLVKHGRKCNDYVGFSARYISEHLK